MSFKMLKSQECTKMQNERGIVNHKCFSLADCVALQRVRASCIHQKVCTNILLLYFEQDHTALPESRTKVVYLDHNLITLTPACGLAPHSSLALRLLVADVARIRSTFGTDFDLRVALARLTPHPHSAVCVRCTCAWRLHASVEPFVLRPQTIPVIRRR